MKGLRDGASGFLVRGGPGVRVGERVLEMTGQLQERVSELVQALGRVKQLEAMVAGSSRV